jgi:hypothetical protein
MPLTDLRNRGLYRLSWYKGLEKNPFSKPYGGLFGRVHGILQRENLGKTPGFWGSSRPNGYRPPSRMAEGEELGLNLLQVVCNNLGDPAESGSFGKGTVESHSNSSKPALPVRLGNGRMSDSQGPDGQPTGTPAGRTTNVRHPRQAHAEPTD